VGEPVKEAQPPEDRYEKAWELHRRWRRTALGVFVAWLPVNAAALAIAGWAFGESGAALVAILTFGVGLFSVVNWILAPCPRCGKPLHARANYGNPFSSRCLNCDIPIGAPRPPDSSA
jgi:hypothetical protein